MKILKILVSVFLIILVSCTNKVKQVDSNVSHITNLLFKNMGRLNRSDYDSIFFLKGCEKDTTHIKSYLSDFLKSSDTTFQMLDKENLIIEYYKVKSTSKFTLAGVSNTDTIISVTDKNGFKLSESNTPFLLQIKEGKIASFGMMKKSNQLYLMTFCN